MKVVIDISPLQTAHKARGIGIYTKHLVRALKNRDDGNEYNLTSKPQNHHADIVHYPFFDFFLPSLPISKRAKTIVTIHDTIPLVYSEKYDPGIKGRLWHLYQKISLRSVDRIICDSKSSKKDVNKYFGISKDLIDVVYLAASSVFKPANEKEKIRIKSKYKLDNNYILYVGDINYNKNIPALVEAFNSISDQAQLVLVARALKNKSLPESKAIFEKINRLKDPTKVKILTNVAVEPEKDLVALYSGAIFYIQPSLYEGFGLPVLEAMSCGVPVVCSNSSSLPEVLGEAGITFNPNDTKSIKESIKAGINLRDDERVKLIAKGKDQAQKFSWEKMAEETLKVYETVNDAK